MQGHQKGYNQSLKLVEKQFNVLFTNSGCEITHVKSNELVATRSTCHRIFVLDNVKQKMLTFVA